MNKEIEPFDYDEDEAIKFIKNTLPQELKEKFSNDEIIYIVDIIYDFYESKGLMNADISDEDDVEIDEDEMIEYVLKNTKKDQVGVFTTDEITFIIKGELEYCDSLNLFE